MKLNWTNFFILMACASVYLLWTKPWNTVTFSVLGVLAVILAIPSYFGSKKDRKERMEQEEDGAASASGDVKLNYRQSAHGKKPKDPAKEALLRAIAEKRKEDPLIGAKLGGKEILQRLLNAMKEDKGVHIESLLAILGSLAGYACQVSVRIQAKLRNAGSPFVTAQGADGKNYFFGDALNKPLAEDKYSVWGLVAFAARENGCKAMPDLKEIFAHSAASVGGENFGVPRIPGDKLGDLPIDIVKNMWPKLFPTATEFCAQPAEWPILFALAAQEAILMSKGVIEPCLALKIVMECAVPASKYELR